VTRKYSRGLALLAAAATLAVACSDDDKGAADTTSAATQAVATTEASTATTEHDHDHGSEPVESPKVVASTSWVAAFASLAGATDITVIAPSNLQHPPDYDPKASDLAAIADADFILVAGFEGFADRMREAAGSDAVVETVATEFFPDALEAEVLRLAEVMGLDAHDAQHNIDHFKEHWMEESERVTAALAGKNPVVVSHAFTTVWAALAGLEPAGTFGPEPLTPTKVAELVALSPTVIFENMHMPAGADLVEATGAIQIDMRNFPGDDLDLMAVVTANADAIIAALG